MRRGLIGGCVLAVLWIGCGWLSFALLQAGGTVATVGELVPSPMGRGVFGVPPLWALLVQLLTVVALIAGYALVVSLLAGRRRATFAAGWIAAVLVGFAVGAVLDLGGFLAWAGQFGIRGALRTMGATQVAAWWAVIVGWIPALAVRRADAGSAADSDADVAADPDAGIRRRPAVLAGLIAAAALVLLPVAAQAGSDATQHQLRQEQAHAQATADPDGAARPDPEASGEPVPTAAQGAIPDDACTSTDSVLMAPAPGAATGHRAQSIQIVNAGTEPCTHQG